jgi:group I intron endonuclease
MSFIDFARAHGLVIPSWLQHESITAPDASDRTCGVYAIQSMRSGRFYVGSSSRIGRRLWTHFQALKQGCHHCRALQLAFDSEGDELFACVILAAGCPKEEAASMEQDLLSRWFGSRACLNASPEAGASLRSPLMRARAQEGRMQSAAFIQHAREQMVKMQSPEMRAKCLAACRASEAFKANSHKQGEALRVLLSRAVVGRCLATGREHRFSSITEAAAFIGATTKSHIANRSKVGGVAYGYTWRRLHEV